MVDLNAGPEIVRAYVKDQAARGLDHVRTLVRGERDAMMALIGDLSEDEARFRPASDEFSAFEALHHLNGSFERSLARLTALSSGREFRDAGPPGGPGSLPAEAPASFAEVRRVFIEGEDAVLAFLDGVDPGAGLEPTADHPWFGAFNWLEWAVYSHHVHTRDHVGQVTSLRHEIERRRTAGGAPGA